MVPLWRKVAMARRSPSASSGVNFAAVMAICIACSWKSGTPSVRLSTCLQFVGRAVGGVGGRVVGRLDAVAAAEIGMHHVALDRARPDDRHLDDEVVEFPRLEARQHRHLRPALHLEDADGIGLAQHVVDGVAVVGAVLRDGGERQVAAVVELEEVEPAPDAAQHAERQHVDLHQAERVDVVLVPLDEGAVVHGGVADRHGLVEPLAGQHEAADMLRQVARKADDLAGQFDRPADRRVAGIEPGLADMVVGQAASP